MSTSAATLQTLLVAVLVENGRIGNNLTEFGIFKIVPSGSNPSNLGYINLAGRFHSRCIKLYRSMNELNARVLAIVPFSVLAATGYTSALAEVLAARDIFPTIRVNTTSTTATSAPFRRKAPTSDDWTRRTNAPDFTHMQRWELQVGIQPILAALERAQVFMGRCIEGLGAAYNAALASAASPGSIPVGPHSEHFRTQREDQRTHWECDACIEWHPISIRQSRRVTWMQVCLAKEGEYV
ncbi:transmembrane protein, putative, partial [Rhizoctonia solani AG-3 Rhs1AP]